MSSERQILEQWAKQNPGLFAGLKQAIAGAEGTLRDGRPNYNILFGGGRFEDLTRHPDKVIRTPRYASAAAGAYQFMPATWGEVQRKLGLSDFSPQSQDIGMLEKVRQRLLPMGGLGAITKAGTLTPEIQAALAPEWASFPTRSGSSYYGQPVKRANEIQQFFEQGKTRAQSSPSPTQPASTSTQTPPSTSKKTPDLFQMLLRQSMMGPAYQSPIRQLLDAQLNSVLTPPKPNPSILTGLAGLGFPSLF
jgi:muramidase (phage lysozyme)